MSIFITLFLTIATFVFIIVPFFKQKLHVVAQHQNEKLQELRSERNTTYSMLKELEFDYESGILTKEDFNELESRYKRKAISTLRRLDDAGREDEAEDDNDSEDEIERQVRNLRSKTKQGAAPINGQPVKEKVNRQSSTGFCTECGTQVQENDKFCANCGANQK